MRDAALPAALLVAALAFALSFAPRRSLLIALPAFAAAAVTQSFITVPAPWIDGLFLACWASVIVTAALVHLPRGLGLSLAVVTAVNAGVWSGLLIAAAGKPLDLALALPLSLLAIPGGWIASRSARIGLKIAASWLVAVALLAAAIPLTTPTPGYVQDHME